MTPGPTLVLDTSTSRCTVLLAAQGTVHALDVEAERAHKEQLLPMVQAVCRSAGLAPVDCVLAGCVVGPGSFTGVRIGVAATQALALAAGCAVVRLDALRLLAVLAQESTAPIVSWRHSRGELYYGACFQGAEAAMPAVAGAGASGDDTVLLDSAAACRRWLAQDGADAALHVGDVPSWLPQPQQVRPTAQISPADRVEALLAQTLAGAQAGVAVAAEAALPIYLPEDSPWRPAKPRYTA